MVKRLILLLVASSLHSLVFANQDEMYCNQKIDYCIKIDEFFLPNDVKRKSYDDGIGLYDKKYQFKFNVWGDYFSQDGFDRDLFITEFLPNFQKKNDFDFLSEKWTTFSYTTIPNGIVIVSSDSKNTSHRVWRYGDRGFVELAVRYPTKHESVIKPRLEQMASSITIR